MVGLTCLGVEHLVLFFSLALHFFLESLLRMLKLPPDIVVGDILIVVDVLVRSPHPQQKHPQHPQQKEYQHYASAHEQLHRHLITR